VVQIQTIFPRLRGNFGLGRMKRDANVGGMYFILQPFRMGVRIPISLATPTQNLNIVTALTMQFALSMSMISLPPYGWNINCIG
jgi:hypothetical protein